MAKNEPLTEQHSPPEGGSVSPDEWQPIALSGDAQTPVQGVTAREAGAKRHSYFKDRDYKR